MHFTYIFLFAQNGFTEQPFDRHEAVPGFRVLQGKKRKQGVVFAEPFCETASLKCRLLPAAAAAAIFTSRKTG